MREGQHEALGNSEMDLKPVVGGIFSRRLRIKLGILLAVASLLAVTILLGLSAEQACILLPTLASLVIFLGFSLILQARVGDYLFGEIGFLYLALGLAYTLFPAFTFLVLDLDIASGWVWQNLSSLLPAKSELGLHLWRHALFLGGVAAGYLAFRGRKLPDMTGLYTLKKQDGYVIIFLSLTLLVSLLCMNLLSAKVDTYIDNYTRYDHLSFVPRKFVSLCTRLKQGFFAALLVFLFINYKKYRKTTYLVVVTMALYEMVFTFGSRIESLIVLLMAICLYHLMVKPISIRKGLLAFLLLGGMFSGVEILRAYGFNVSQTRSAVSDRGFQPASEFGAVYFTGFHLYNERAQGTLPPKELPMFFNDFISLVTPNDFVDWNPQYWYAKAYFPDAVVPPETMGPIADSAIWGGEWDLLLRSLLNGAFFAYIVRWFITRRQKWWALAVYSFCYATCIMTLKYSVFYHLNPLFKTFLPTILLIEGFRKLGSLYPSSQSSAAGPIL